MTKIECKVWCVGNSAKEIEMGLPEGDSWMPYAFDMRAAESIKLAGANDFLGNDKATINFKSGMSVTIDKTFQEMVELFLSC